MKRFSDFVGDSPPHKTHLGFGIKPDSLPVSNLAQTLASNTGYDSQPDFECGVDWLDFTFRNVDGEGDAEDIIAEVENLTGDLIDFSFTRPVFNGRMWDGHGRGMVGVCVWYDNGRAADDSVPDSPQQLKFSLSGKVMSAVTFSALAAWLTGRAAANELDCTRIDICLDDKKRSVEMGKITQARSAGNFFNATYSALNSSSNRGEAEGVTVYFGHPSSHKRLRIYDKSVESKGAVPGIRWEAQFRKAVAHNVLYSILEKIDVSIEEATTYFKSVVTGLIDFRDRGGDDPNRTRCPHLCWFSEFCRAVAAAPVRIRAEIREPVVQKSIDWLTKSVAQSLSVVKKVLREDFQQFIETTITDGGERLSNKKRDLIERTDRGKLLYSM